MKSQWRRDKHWGAWRFISEGHGAASFDGEAGRTQVRHSYIKSRHCFPVPPPYDQHAVSRDIVIGKNAKSCNLTHAKCADVPGPPYNTRSRNFLQKPQIGGHFQVFRNRSIESSVRQPWSSFNLSRTSISARCSVASEKYPPHAMMAA
jgi:hypothetical protein